MFCVYLVYKFYNRWHNTSKISLFHILGEVGANLLYLTDHTNLTGAKLERYKRKRYRAQQKNEHSTSQNRKQQQYKCWGHL
ncbi:unnamed protein product [Callosobruchus maculatus]|uniref:Uncharacterized protein n=1 Tax=Callosobruchus maculatus TaxID=64391 RepID=A0A653CAP6_CALMS|nr:unnamed protein product [Callosobruchus maculatus]